MAGVKSLQQLIHQFSDAEYDLCRNYLLAFDSRGKAFENKSVKLLDILSKSAEEDMTESDIVFYLYGNKSVKAFPRLVLRLRDKLLDALLLEPNILREDLYPKRVQKRLIIRRRLNQVDILLQRKLPLFAEVILEGIVETAKEYELFDEQIAALRLQYQFARHMKKHPTEVHQIHEDIVTCRHQTNTLEAVTELERLMKTYTTESLKDELKVLLPYRQQSSTAQSEYYFNKIQAHIELSNNNYSDAELLLKRQLKLLTAPAFVDDPEKRTGVLLQMSRLAILQHQFSRAINILSEVEPLIPENNPKLNIIACYRFHALFYQRHFRKAYDILQLADPAENIWQFNYLKAVVFLLLGRSEEGISLLEKLERKELLCEQFGAWPSLLMQMLIVDYGMKNKKINAIQQLRAFHHKHSVPATSETDEAQVYYVFQDLITTKLDFKTVFQQDKERLDFLRPKETSSLPAFDPELVPFYDWFMAKMMQTRLTDTLTLPVKK